jgi:uncharacterized membrane protein YphA (DoxX/SURF4 family)
VQALIVDRPIRSFVGPWTRQACLLWVVAACQAISLVISWPLWQVHTFPPMLPALPLPTVDLGVPLQVSLIAAVARPGVGVPLHALLLGYAILIDQTRLQPEFVSLALLLWGCLPSHRAMMLARVHLISLWLFSGLNKLLSTRFMSSTAQWMLDAYPPVAPDWLRDHVGFIVVIAEMSLGILAIFPSTRRLVGVLAAVVHLNILLVLSPWGNDWNEVVWPWNAALAVAGFCLIAPWQEGLLESIRRCGRFASAGLVGLMVMPVGFYLLIVDAYLAHNLYTSNTPDEMVCDARNRCDSGGMVGASWRAFNVPLPPEHRIFAARFAQTCTPGDRLIITDSRALARWLGRDRVTVPCPT